MPQLTRRTFLQTTSLATAGAILGGCATTRWHSRVMGANEAVRLGVVGLNGRGKDLIEKSLSPLKDARVTAICDVDSAVLEAVAKTLSDKGQVVDTYADYRVMLDRADIDAVVIATPNHQHALQAIWACQTGLDVYLEKPVSHDMWEGRKIMAAADKYRRVIQVGSQARSSESVRAAVEWAKAGNLGKILIVRGLCYKRRDTIGLTTGPQPIPATVNYDLWLGTAQEAPLRRTKLHYDWHWQWPYGNGDLGNQGVHQLDIARWFLGEEALPPHVLSLGGRLGYEDDGNTPNTLVTWYDYAKAPLVFEVRGLPVSAGSKLMDNMAGQSVGVVVQCEGGMIVVPATYASAQALDKDGKVVKDFTGGISHASNFIEVVRSRKTSNLFAPILEGHLSSSLAHLGNISYRVGKTQAAEATREQIKGNAALSEAYGRMVENLKANNVDLAKTPATLGAALTVDPVKERFIGNDAANALLRREYRKPFVVPDNV